MPPNITEVNPIIAQHTDEFEPKPQGNKYTRLDVLQHHDRDDCYLIIHGKVYSVSNFIDEHPGGEIITTYAGEDATDVFAAFHPPSAYNLLSPYCVGELYDEEKEEKNKLVRDARNLRILFKKQGYYESSKLYYTFKVLSNVAIAMTSLSCLYFFPGNSLAVLVAAFLMGLFWQQCGWLSHDFLHHQVFTNRSINNLMGFILGGFFQGFSVDWWKNKHNTHHAVPNIHGADPDVNTMPFLAWSEHALEGFADPAARETLPKFLIDHQAIFYAPLLAFGRISWAIQSALWVKDKKNIANPLAEKVSLTLHWMAYFSIIAFLCEGWGNKVLFFLASQLSCGVLLAAVFSLNHNGMPIFTKQESRDIDYFTRQILTGRAVTNTLFVTWFTGGLNYQIEHHLFPMIPRHHFHKIQPLVESLCRENGVKYHKTGFFSGTWEIFERLIAVGNASKKL